MRALTAGLLAGALLALAAPPARAQLLGDKVKVEEFRAGFRNLGGNTDPDESTAPGLCRKDAWAPVYVKLRARSRVPAVGQEGTAELVVEATDNDGIQNLYRVALPVLEPKNDDESADEFVLFARPGEQEADLTVSVRLNGQNLGTPLKKSANAQSTADFIYLSIGATLPGMRPPVAAGGEAPAAPGVPGGRAEAHRVFVTRVEEMPQQWFGYESVDLAVLTTGGPRSGNTFLNRLKEDAGGRRAALVEWVRRGGHLVVSTGVNQEYLTAERGMAELAELLPVKLSAEGPGETEGLDGDWARSGDPVTLAGKVTRARFTVRPDRGVQVLARTRPTAAAGAASEPLVVQAGYGAGRVTFVGFDLDRAPFTNWERKDGFWRALLVQAGPTYRPGAPAADAGLLAGLQNYLEQFEGVRVVPFGYVALFILIYIIIVGPLDYFLLKKVVKRLELTWITFPAVVLVVSVGAYLTAYALKGNELKVNKLDVVDIDLATRSVSGRTWFAIFSPDIRNYTLGIEPAGSWAAPAKEGDAPPTISWLRARGMTEGAFRRSYEYAPAAAGLVNVPIQVWSTKGFTASWSADLPAGDRPIVESQLRLSREMGRREDAVTGKIVTRLPKPLAEPRLVWRNRSYPLRSSEDPRLGGHVLEVEPGVSDALGEWLGRETPLAGSGTPTRYRSNSFDPTPPGLRMWSILFYEAVPTKPGEKVIDPRPFARDPSLLDGTGNALLRNLDQSWRVGPNSKGEEAILVGRMPTEQAVADTVTDAPATPSRLWLGELPKADAARPSLPGRMKQETWVRVFIPVAANKP